MSHTDRNRLLSLNLYRYFFVSMKSDSCALVNREAEARPSAAGVGLRQMISCRKYQPAS
jgi:hypothetical protein